MEPPHGKAPVHLHDVMHALQTAIGARPRPTGDKSEAMTPVPVLVSVMSRDPLHPVRLFPASEWALYPYQPDVRDEETGEVTYGCDARFVVAVTLPAGWRIVNDNQPPGPVFTTPDAAAEAVEVPPASLAEALAKFLAGGVPAAVHTEPVASAPEFAHLPADFFKTDTTKPAGFSGKRDAVPNAGDQGG